VNWTAVTDTVLSGYYAIYGITYRDGKFVAVGNNGKAAASADGENWEAVDDTAF